MPARPLNFPNLPLERYCDESYKEGVRPVSNFNDLTPSSDSNGYRHLEVHGWYKVERVARLKRGLDRGRGEVNSFDITFHFIVDTHALRRRSIL